MIRRLYVHRFRCLENFTLSLAGLPSVLLIGKNGAGKSTVGFALEVLQKIARGTNRVKDLATASDFTRGEADTPMRFEIELELDSERYEYSVAFELPKGFKELRVFDEKLTVNGSPVYSRNAAKVTLHRSRENAAASFSIDWHLVALPIVQLPAPGPLSALKEWLGRLLILRPIPQLMSGESDEGTLHPDATCAEYGAWFTGLLAQAPAAYTKIDAYLRTVMPDFLDVQNPATGVTSRNLVVSFRAENAGLSLSFKDLSAGEKCHFVCAATIAATHAYGPVACYWDEPDAHLSLSEVGHFVLRLRRELEKNGQLIMTSHNAEAIRRFADENTLVLYRRSHLEPPNVRLVGDLQVDGNLVDALIRGDVEP